MGVPFERAYEKETAFGHQICRSDGIGVLLVSLFLDWIRKPDEPASAAGRPLTLLSGQRLTLGQFSRDKAVLVYFWGSWCGVCRYQSPIIDDLAADGVLVVGVAVRSAVRRKWRRIWQNAAWALTANDEDGGLARSWRIVTTSAVVLVKMGKWSIIRRESAVIRACAHEFFRRMFSVNFCFC